MHPQNSFRMRKKMILLYQFMFNLMFSEKAAWTVVLIRDAAG